MTSNRRERMARVEELNEWIAFYTRMKEPKKVQELERERANLQRRPADKEEADDYCAA